MPIFEVVFTMDKIYSVNVKAANRQEAEQMVDDGFYGEEPVCIGEQYQGFTAIYTVDNND